MRWPWLTLAVFALTLLMVVAQTLNPEMLAALQWDAAAVAEGELWRIFTGPFVHSNGWGQIISNLTGLLLIGWLTEQQWSRRAWAAAAVTGVAAAEASAIWWYTVGGGISVLLGGLVGLLVAGWLSDRRLPGWFRFGVPVAYLVGAGYVVSLTDIHGPPVFAGVLTGALLLRERRTSARRTADA